MWTKQKSLIASLIMTGILFIIIITASISLPYLLKLYSKITGITDYKNLMTALYISAIPGFICNISLFKLLFNIKNDFIFVQKNVTLLRILSWCCFLVGTEYIIFGLKHISLLLLSFAAFFIGLILRVIKNIFDKAIILREENDYTI